MVRAKREARKRGRPSAVRPRAIRLEPIEHVNLTDRIYQTIKERIISQEIEVGARLRDEEIASQLGVSRTPVREALMHLSREGLVEVIPRSGTRVRTFTEQDIRDIFEVRGALEKLAVRKAAKRLQPEDLRDLRRRWEKAEEALALGEIKPAIELDRQMHSMLFVASGNRQLEELMERINQYIALFRNLGAGTPDHVGFTHALPALIAALERQDPDAATRAMEEHIEAGREQTLRDFRKRQLLDPVTPEV